jgi:hypothetical protein
MSLYIPLRPNSCYMPCPSHFLSLIILIILGEAYKLCSFLQPHVTSSLFGPNILNTLFSNTLSLCSSRNVRDQVLDLYRTTSKVIVLYILILMFLDSRREEMKIQYGYEMFHYIFHAFTLLPVLFHFCDWV